MLFYEKTEFWKWNHICIFMSALASEFVWNWGVGGGVFPHGSNQSFNITGVIRLLSTPLIRCLFYNGKSETWTKVISSPCVCQLPLHTLIPLLLSNHQRGLVSPSNAFDQQTGLKGTRHSTSHQLIILSELPGQWQSQCWRRQVSTTCLAATDKIPLQGHSLESLQLQTLTCSFEGSTSHFGLKCVSFISHNTKTRPDFQLG